ncbi:hypothetical protein GN156_16315 [bacterium LRH843]|nr:hypothetical protein [bacterium LRH843]
MSKSLLSSIFFSIIIMLSACGNDVPNNSPNEPPAESTQENTGESTAANGTTGEITEFSLDIDLASKEKVEVEFEVETNETKAIYNVGDQSLKAEDALVEIEKMFKELEFTPELSEDEIIEKVLAYFQVSRDDVTDFNLDIEFNHQDIIEIDKAKL